MQKEVEAEEEGERGGGGGGETDGAVGKTERGERNKREDASLWQRQPYTGICLSVQSTGKSLIGGRTDGFL